MSALRNVLGLALCAGVGLVLILGLHVESGWGGGLVGVASCALYLGGYGVGRRDRDRVERLAHGWLATLTRRQFEDVVRWGKLEMRQEQVLSLLEVYKAVQVRVEEIEAERGGGES